MKFWKHKLFDTVNVLIVDHSFCDTCTSYISEVYALKKGGLIFKRLTVK